MWHLLWFLVPPMISCAHQRAIKSNPVSIKKPSKFWDGQLWEGCACGMIRHIPTLSFAKTYVPVVARIIEPP